MTSPNQSQFVESVAQEFREHYPEHGLASASDETEAWFRCGCGTPSRARFPLAFGICDGAVTVAFDGLTCPVIICPPAIKPDTSRRKAFALFDELIPEWKVSISFWQRDECFGVEFVERARVQTSRWTWADYEIRVRSWTGKYDHDYTAERSTSPNGGPAKLPGNAEASEGPPSVS